MSKEESMFNEQELKIIEEIVGGRFDALNELVDGYPNISNKAELKANIATLRPIVEKLRNND